MKRKIRDFYLINQIIMPIFFNTGIKCTLFIDNLLSEHIKSNGCEPCNVN